MRHLDAIAHANRLTARAALEKAVFAGGLVALDLALPVWPVAPLVLLLALGGLALARIAWRDILAALAVPVGFLLAGALGLALTLAPDFPYLAPAPDQGRAALAVTMRALAAVAALIFLALTTPIHDLADLLERARVPAPVIELARLVYHLLFLLIDTAFAMQAAQAARQGWRDGRRSLRSLGLLLAALLPRALDRARRLEIGLAARGFDGRLRVLCEPRPASLSWLAGIILLQGCVLIAGLA
jgi:cobalt/nickel transport system permease protein